jgi:hypothetical protein
LNTKWCFKRRTFFETLFLPSALDARGVDKLLIIKAMQKDLHR